MTIGTAIVIISILCGAFIIACLVSYIKTRNEIMKKRNAIMKIRNEIMKTIESIEAHNYNREITKR